MEQNHDHCAAPKEDRLSHGDAYEHSCIPCMVRNALPQQDQKQHAHGCYGEEHAGEERDDSLLWGKKWADAEKHNHQGCQREECRERNAEEEGGHGG